MQTHSTNKHLGTACGLLAACVATLAGVALGLDPDVILWRAGISAIIVGLVSNIVVRIVHSVLEDQN